MTDERYSLVVHDSDARGTYTEFLHPVPDAEYAFLAPHGGQVEPNTDTEAMLTGGRVENATVWGTRGLVDGSYDVAFDRWHTTEDTNPLHTFPLYQQCRDQEYTVAVSFHAMSADGFIVGGRAPESMRQGLCSALREYFPAEDVRLGVTGDPCAGMKPGNFVNALDVKNPVHLEQNVNIATQQPTKLARAVGEWITSLP